MSVQDEALGPSSDSFWDIEGYKPTVKRQEDGARLCTDLMALIQERADIEKTYAKSLSAWSKKWMQNIEKGPEYGTTQAAWKGVLVESEGIAQIHTEIRDQLLTEVSSKIKEWKQTNFKKAVVGNCKETKQLEEDFKKAQKPWAKKYSKVKDARKHFHNSSKMEKSYTNQENNAKADSGMSHDQLKKIQDKAEKCRRDVVTSQQKYEAALTDLNSYNPKYMEDMTMVFERSDSNEEKRLVFFKEMLFGIHRCLDISQNTRLPEIYLQLNHTIDQADYQKDLKWWSQHRGKDMGMHWPQFEEFREELHDISRQRSRDSVPDSAGIMLRRINTDKYKQEFSTTAEYQEGHHAISRKEKTKSQHIGGTDGIMLTGLKTDNAQPPPSYNTVAANGSTKGSDGNNPSPNLQRLPSYDNELNPFDGMPLDDRNTVDLSAMEEQSPNQHSTPAPPQTVSVTTSPPANAAINRSDQQKKIAEEYDESLNPFGDEEPDKVDQSRASEATSPSKTIPTETPPAAEVTVSSGATKTAPKPPPKPPRSPHLQKVQNQNPFGDDDFDDDEIEQVDTSNGVPVRAIYDYVGQEGDELSFKEGDVFLKLKDKDSQGWCTGMKDGRIALYPDNYVTLV